jgi:hypothetical protein
MAPTVVVVSVAAALGVILVMYGIVTRHRANIESETGPTARVTYRTLADVREQLRRRFEPTGAPVWIAAQQAANPLAADLAALTWRCARTSSASCSSAQRWRSR